MKRSTYGSSSLPLGLSGERAGFGTLSLSVTGMTAPLAQSAGELRRSPPARNLMIVNGHGGNRGLLEVLAYEFKDFELNACALHIGRTDEPDNGAPACRNSTPPGMRRRSCWHWRSIECAASAQ